MKHYQKAIFSFFRPHQNLSV